MVKAIRIHEFGEADVLKWEDIEVGEPGPGELRLCHTVIGFNFLDIMVRKGSIRFSRNSPRCSVPKPPGLSKPWVRGGQFRGRPAGRLCLDLPGSYAEGRLIDAAQVIALPDNVSDEDAAASLLKGMTAEYLIHRTFPAQSGQTALVHAAAGGVGLFLCQWLASKGVDVIGTVGSDAKKETILANGAKHAVNYKTENFTEVAREVTGGVGVDVVYDSVGKDHWQGSIDSAATAWLYGELRQCVGSAAAHRFGGTERQRLAVLHQSLHALLSPEPSGTGRQRGDTLCGDLVGRCEAGHWPVL